MNIDNEKVRALKSVLYDFSRSDYVSIKSGETFSEVLTRYIDEVQAKSDIKQHNIADESNMKSSLISQYKAGTRQPTLKAVVQLCLAMHLTPDRSKHLLYSAGYILNDCKEHRIYKMFLFGCAFDSFYSNETLDIIMTEDK